MPTNLSSITTKDRWRVVLPHTESGLGGEKRYRGPNRHLAGVGLFLEGVISIVTDFNKYSCFFVSVSISSDKR